MFHYFITQKRHTFEKGCFTELEWASICNALKVDPKIVDRVVIPHGAVICGDFNEGDKYDG